MKKYRSYYILLVLVLVLSGCMPTTPEPPFVSVETIVVATYAAIQAQTEAAMPVATTSTPSATPIESYSTVTPIFTNTSFVISSLTPIPTSTTIPSATPTNVTSGSGNVLYSCEVVSSSPGSGYEVKKNKNFIWTIRVKNTGTVKWDRGDTKIAHIKGAEYYIEKRVLLEETTKTGEIGEFRVELYAPEEQGRYTSTWTMRKGIHDFCVIKYQIYVVE